ncbi:MAG: hypothetical protein U1F65_10820 [Verrucomicrobiota bacterium]
MSINLISKTVALALAYIGTSLPLFAAPVTFWYGGYIYEVYNPSNLMPIAVTAGMPFTGRITYDSAHVSSATTNTVPGGSFGNYYIEDLAGFTSVFQIGGHVVTNKSALDGYTGQIQVGNNYQGRDSLLISASPGGDLQLDGASLGNTQSTPQRFSTMDIMFDDYSMTALTHPGLPTSAPNLSKFPDYRDWRWGCYLDDGLPTQLYGVVGVITAISANEVVILSETRISSSSMRVSWPKLNTGFTLQVSTNLAAGSWQTATNQVTQTAFENTATISTTGTPKFYRLKK